MDPIQTALDLPPCCQVGFVFARLEEAIARYAPLFGPFEIVDYGEIEGASFRGRPAPYRIRMGIGYSGPLELELIEWVSGETPHREFLEAGRSGMHHLSFTVAELDSVVERARPLGFEPIWYHRMTDEIAYAYLERAGDPLLVELMERPWTGGNVRRAPGGGAGRDVGRDVEGDVGGRLTCPARSGVLASRPCRKGSLEGA